MLHRFLPLLVLTASAIGAEPVPFRVPSLQGLNYGSPGTVSGEWAGPAWLRSGTGAADRWKDCQPKLEADLAHLQAHPNLGRVHRIFIGLDQFMVWDKTTGFVRFHDECLENFATVLKMFDASGLKAFVVLYA